MRNTGPSREVRLAVVERDRERCRRCNGMGTEIHHRVSRQSGGTRAEWINGFANLVLLCSACHLFVTERPAYAYATGWSVRRNSLDDPEQIPVVAVWGHQYLLTDEGGVIPVGIRVVDINDEDEHTHQTTQETA